MQKFELMDDYEVEFMKDIAKHSKDDNVVGRLLCVIYGLHTGSKSMTDCEEFNQDLRVCLNAFEVWAFIESL